MCTCTAQYIHNTYVAASREHKWFQKQMGHGTLADLAKDAN